MRAPTSLVGSDTDSVLGSVTLDIAFIGVNGIDAPLGATSHGEREAAVNALMASRAAPAVIAADASKIDTRAVAAIGAPRCFPTITTDREAASAQRRLLAEAGYEVIIAE